MRVNLPVPDYITVSRCNRKLPIDFIYKKTNKRINVILDSSGIKVLGEKEWINYKYGFRQRKICRKLHIGVTDDGSIIAGEVTTLRDSDIATVPNLLSQISNNVNNIFGAEKNQDILIHFLNDILGYKGEEQNKSYFKNT